MAISPASNQLPFIVIIFLRTLSHASWGVQPCLINCTTWKLGENCISFSPSPVANNSYKLTLITTNTLYLLQLQSNENKVPCKANYKLFDFNLVPYCQHNSHTQEMGSPLLSQVTWREDQKLRLQLPPHLEVKTKNTYEKRVTR